MNKFTPGPWEIKTHAAHYSIMAGNNIICDSLESTSSDCDTDLANAKLIRAAPEMFSTLEKIRSMYNDFETYPLIPMSKIREMLNEVLTKVNENEIESFERGESL